MPPSLLAATLGLVTLAAVETSSPPNWNTDAICTRVAGASTDIQSKDQCRRAQEDALAELRKGWASYPADLRSRCSEEASLNGQTSYVDLVECINLGILSRKNEGTLPSDNGGQTGRGRPRN